MLLVLHGTAQQSSSLFPPCSRALAGYHNVAEEIRQLVLETAQEMDCHLNAPIRQTPEAANCHRLFHPHFQLQLSDSFSSELLADTGRENLIRPI
jgi:hypothetical protein